MTSDRDFKRLVRRRMQKTGESYTAARSRMLTVRPGSSTRSPAPPAATPAPATSPSANAAPDYAALAGIREDAVAAKTGCGWTKWVYVLDKAGAQEWAHRDIARYVAEKYRVGGWWAQTVTVGYERIKGLRAVGQRRDGGFSASRSRTFPVPVATLYRACRHDRLRSGWLRDAALTIRTAIKDRSIRARDADGVPVSFWFTAKGAAKAQVQVQVEPLPDRATADRVKAEWGERLDRLEDSLG
ncbi:MAG: hypothetical protein FJ206_14810 [Gemmatimonadetes bacterium]|nr:hypothetical protein [Gemmatimonadota bacterium]